MAPRGVKTGKAISRLLSTVSDGQTSKPEKPIFVMKIKSLPYGFFERELLKYFSQFGQVIRVRVARSKQTGNHKGWAYVGFADKEVAEVACETMDGYLMFDHRLRCAMMKEVPSHMKSGPRFLRPPGNKASAKKAALEMNKPKTAEQLEKSMKKRLNDAAKRAEKLRALGINYELESFAVKPIVETKKEEEGSEMKDVHMKDDDDDVVEVEQSSQASVTSKNAKKNKKKAATTAKPTKVVEEIVTTPVSTGGTFPKKTTGGVKGRGAQRKGRR